jgi:hypothetical protein
VTVARGFDVLRPLDRAPPPESRSPIRLRLRREALALAARERLVEAAYSYRIVPLESPAGRTLCLDGEILEAPWLLPSSGTLTAVACAVATIGPALEARVSGLFAHRQAALAVALDELGTELVFAAARRVQDRMLAEATRQGLAMAGELRSGDPGLAIETQAAVLRLAAAAAIGVSLSSGLVMRPLKSTSMVLGVGLALPEVRWSRCDYCPSLERCRVAQSRPAVTA